MKKREVGMLERLKLRAEVHRRQVIAFERLVMNLKPEWYKPIENRLIAPVDDNEHPVNLIHQMFSETDKAWENNGDWEKTLDDASQRFAESLRRLKELENE